MALAIRKRWRQYSRGTRAAWISPQRIWKRWPSRRKSLVPMAKVCVGGEASAVRHVTVMATAHATTIPQKPEIRNPKSERNPKPEARRKRFGREEEFGFRISAFF